MSRTVLACLALVALAGCDPEYPMCKKESQCRVGELCVDQRCVRCAGDSDCLMGEKCVAGACETPLERCQANADCPDGMACLFELCSQCYEEDHCDGDMRCVDGRCQGCADDGDCGDDETCKDGSCAALVVETEEVIGPGGCDLEPVYFEFDSFALTKDAMAVIEDWVDCLVEGETYTLIGRADMKGEEGYNLSLGLDRAKAVKKHLVSLGFPADHLVVATAGKHIAKDDDHDKDRRVDIQ
jgi:hypothetical protein